MGMLFAYHKLFSLMMAKGRTGHRVSLVKWLVLISPSNIITRIHHLLHSAWHKKGSDYNQPLMIQYSQRYLELLLDLLFCLYF